MLVLNTTFYPKGGYSPLLIWRSSQLKGPFFFFFNTFGPVSFVSSAKHLWANEACTWTADVYESWGLIFADNTADRWFGHWTCMQFVGESCLHCDIAKGSSFIVSCNCLKIFFLFRSLLCASWHCCMLVYWGVCIAFVYRFVIMRERELKTQFKWEREREREHACVYLHTYMCVHVFECELASTNQALIFLTPWMETLTLKFTYSFFSLFFFG